MNVRIRIQFKPPIKDDWRAMRSLAKSLTDDPKGIRVSADAAQADWLVVEFTMPTQAQYKALPRIESAIRLHAWRRWDSTFAFPYTEAERARADRRAARRKARRKQKRDGSGDLPDPPVASGEPRTTDLARAVVRRL